MFAQIINIHWKNSLILRIKENPDYNYIYSFNILIYSFLKSYLSHMCVTSAYIFKEFMHITISFYIQQSRTVAK